METQLNTEMRMTNFHNILLREFSNAQSSGLWAAVAAVMAEMKDTLLRLQGGVFGRPVFERINESLHGKKRKGTDGATYGTYSAVTDPFIGASGEYADSFMIQSQSPLEMEWGSKLGPYLPDNPNFTRDDGMAYLADVIPYVTWKIGAKGKMKKYVQRYIMPDLQSPDAADKLRDIMSWYVQDVFARAAAASGLDAVNPLGDSV